MNKLALLFSLLLSCTLSAQPEPKVKNVILMIGDGTGLAQWSAARERLGEDLHVYTLSEYIGLSQTSSSSNLITDSGAGATAISIGEKNI